MKIFLSLFVFISISAFAVEYEYTGKVEWLGPLSTRDSDDDYLLLKGFKNSGSCKKENGMTVLKLRSDTDDNDPDHYSIAAAARAEGKKVRVSLDDTLKAANGDCYLNDINTTR